MTKIQYITRCDRATLICLVVNNERCASAPVQAVLMMRASEKRKRVRVRKIQPITQTVILMKEVIMDGIVKSLDDI